MSENVQTFSGKVNVADNLLVGTSHFFVDRQNNRVGIGTSTPDASSMLDVTGNIKSGGTITATGGFSGDGSGLSGVNSDSGSWVNGSSSNIHLAVSTDNVGIGVLDPSSKLDVDGDINIASGSTLKVGGTPAVFSNWSVDGSDIYRPSGNVGIGTTEPETIFQIGSKAQTTGVNYLKIRGNNVSASALPDICGIIFNNSDIASLDGLRGESKIINERAGNNYGSALAFYTNPTDAGTGGTGVDSVKRMVIDDEGNVGIGTTSPGETLDILGSLRVGGDGMLTINERTNSGFDGTARDETIALQTTIDGRTLAQGAVYGHEPRVALALQPDFGYVGVGTVSPVTKLDVGGRIYGSGTVVQVRDRYMQSSWTTTSGSYNGDIPQSLETGVKWNITPTKTSSRILVNFKFIAYFAGMNGYSNGARCQIWRKIGSTYSRVYGVSGSYHDLHYYSVIRDHHAYISISFVDSPGTTSVVEYALRARMYLQVGTMYIGNGGHQPVTIQLMEIGG
jgi:hypothetical protein